MQQTVHGLQSYLSSQGASPADALHQSYGLIGEALSGQARLWSYVDDFRYMALMCFGCIPIVFALKKTVGRRGALRAGTNPPQARPSAAKSRINFAALTARLEAAPFQNRFGS